MRNAAVIMAGGSGTRLWPLSRRARPKQLLHIVEGRSLIYKAYERLSAIFAPNDIYVISLAEHIPAISKELPLLPKENLIGEPTGRDTANAIALSAAILDAKDPETIMGVFTADHLIRPADVFADVVRRGFAVAQEHRDALVTFGIKPTEPHTGLGYVERGDPISPGVYHVRRFKEKPDLATAREYVASGNYYWNSGMFVWRTATILKQLEERLEESVRSTRRIAAEWGGARGSELAAELYPSLQKISIDFAVMEKAPRVLTVEMALDWLDVGNWTALSAVLSQDAADNTNALKRWAAMASRNNILVSENDHMIATIGVENLVIVHSEDATLICHRDQIQRIKEIVAELEVKYGSLYS